MNLLLVESRITSKALTQRFLLGLQRYLINALGSVAQQLVEYLASSLRVVGLVQIGAVSVIFLANRLEIVPPGFWES